MSESLYLIRSASVDITNKCNFRCLHCYNFSGEHNRENELSDDEIIKIFNELIDFQPNSLCICGGEPLLRVNLVYELCELVKKRNPSIALNMVSNGYFFNEAIAKTLKEKGLDLIQFSLDGFTPDTHNWIRNNESAYTHVIKAIKIAKDVGFVTNVACCPTKVNFNEIDSVIQLCNELGVELLRFQPLMIMGRGTNLEKYVLSDEEYQILSHKIKSYNNKKMKLLLEWGDPIQHIENIIYTNKENSFNDFGISAYGDIMASPYIPIKVGNIRNRKFREYLDVGLQNIYLDKFIKKSASLITEWDKMNMNNVLNKFPKLGLEQNINYDLLDKENNDTETVKAIMGLVVSNKL